MSLFGNLSDIPESGPVEPGEYDLRIVQAKEQSYNSGAKAILLICEVLDNDNADDIFHKLWLPTDTDTEKKAATKLRMIKEFLDAIGLNPDDVQDPGDFVGIEFTAKLKIDEYEGQRRNEVERVV